MHTLQAFSSSKYMILFQTYGLQTNHRERETEREREREKLLNEYHKKVGLDVMVGILLLRQKGEGISVFTFQLIKYAHIYVNLKRTPKDPITQIMNQKQFIT